MDDTVLDTKQQKIADERENGTIPDAVVRAAVKNRNRHVHFAFDKADVIGAATKEMIAKAAEDFKAYLNKDPDALLYVVGGADMAGEERPAGRTRNVLLAQMRADAVKAALVDHGVDPNAVVAQGFGATRPVEPTEVGVRNAANRYAAIAMPIALPPTRLLHGASVDIRQIDGGSHRHTVTLRENNMYSYAITDARTGKFLPDPNNGGEPLLPNVMSRQNLVNYLAVQGMTGSGSAMNTLAQKIGLGNDVARRQREIANVPAFDGNG